MDLDLKVYNSFVILKDRPYFKDGLEIDLGEMTMTNAQKIVTDRIKAAPSKKMYMTSLLSEAKNVSIKYIRD